MTKKSSQLENILCGILLCISIAALVIACLAFTKKKPGIPSTVPPPMGKCNSSNNCCCHNSDYGTWGDSCTRDRTCGIGSSCAYTDGYDVFECGN